MSPIAGEDRLATAIGLSSQREASTAVVLASSQEYADALVGAPFAAKLGAPVHRTAAKGASRMSPSVTVLHRIWRGLGRCSA